MSQTIVEISSKGRNVKVPALESAGFKIVSPSRWLKIAEIYDEPWNPNDVSAPQEIIAALKAGSLPSDLFSFAQKLYDPVPRFDFPYELDNAAVVETSSFDKWWEALPQETRKNVRRAAKRGVTSSVATFDDALVAGIKSIYDESPIRQGRRFWHFGKSFQQVKEENATFLDRATFIAAHHEGELIGFVKMIHVGPVANLMQIVSKASHSDKRPTNALIAKAVEVCAEKGLQYFVYGQYIYGNNSDAAIIEFKRRNGFQQIQFPRYYIPLTLKGSLAVRLGLHLGLRRLLPRKLDSALLTARARALDKLAARKSTLSASQA